MTREVPTSKAVTIWMGDGRWFRNRGAAYYAIARRLVIERYPRWLQDRNLEDPVSLDDPRVKTQGDCHAWAEGMPLEVWRDRRRRRDELFTTYIPESYDEPPGEYFDPDKWKTFVLRVARFLKFVDRRRAALATEKA